MAMTERSRSILFQRLSSLTHDDEAVGEMMSYFPARDVEEPATKEFVRAEIHAATTRFIVWTISTNTAILGLFVALTRGG
ncbi:hypothetical protein PO878_01820 [Iamia majanohamensis]|uniref:Uncharacterized protein n=1 Tax=Iamia majanohamensis TaxID=467976 RepID=A0AAE9Y6A2_9ACTN|nr:hypothetical protein [Iamia majanohamensis]WCO67455.1 hypothetical protein PO878_01820 [Iamia majanohamensis]